MTKNGILYMIFFVTLLGLAVICEKNAFAQVTNNSNSYNIPKQTSDYLEITSNSEGHKQVLRLPVDQLLFNVTPIFDQSGALQSLSMSLKPSLADLYNDIGLANKPKDIVFVYPSFTQAAYEKNGFYDYYNKKCDIKCLTVPIPTKVDGFQSSSIAGAWALKLLHYPYVKDEDIDKNPDILKQYKRVIVLHNEYVTKKEFDAITSHPDVMFLYPNALYAEVKTNYTSNTISLVQGHGYPDTSIKNGFGWKYDNSGYEYDVECNTWNFYKKDNYTMLDCYPEYRMLYSTELLRALQLEDPEQIIVHLTDWINHPNSDPSVLLSDYGIKGTHMPTWIVHPATWAINGDITKSQFARMLEYLHEKNIIR
jgi:hypothetical protein